MSENPFIAQIEAEEARQASPPTAPQKGFSVVRSRERYSSDPKERMRELVEDGKMGPQFGKLGGGRRKRSNRRATEVIAEAASQKADEIKDALIAMAVGYGTPDGVRLQAIDRLLKAEADEEKLRREDEDRDFEQMAKAELVDFILNGLGALQKAGSIAAGAIDLDEQFVEELE